MAAFAGQVPRAWGLQLPGVLTRLPAGSAGIAGIALTFDCCGGPGGNAVDQALIDTLQKTGTPATFFLNFRWVQANPGPAKSLAENPLFDIGNHGTRHVPLSVSGRSAYGIPGTASAAEVYDEVMLNQDALYALILSPFVRPGTTSEIPYNHYSLLKSIEDLFALPHLGYAAAPGLARFGSDVWSTPLATGS